MIPHDLRDDILCHSEASAEESFFPTHLALLKVSISLTQKHIVSYMLSIVTLSHQEAGLFIYTQQFDFLGMRLVNFIQSIVAEIPEKH